MKMQTHDREPSPNGNRDGRAAASSSAAARRGRRRLRWLGLGLALGMLGGLVWSLRGAAEPLTAETLRRARERWEKHGPDHYLMVIEVRGAQRGRHRIHVRGGKVIDMTTGGREVSADAWKYHTVEGWFRFLETELANAAQPDKVYGVSPTTRVVLRARFDLQWGYPRYFLRHVPRRGRDVPSQDIEWIVRSFEVHEAGKEP